MLCPVCKTECGNETVCAKCGFDQLQVEFLSREEATHWTNNIVMPYREKWQTSQMITSVDWKEVLFRQKEIRYFFDVTIPAAASKNEVLGHTLLVCPYKRLRECFIEQLGLQLPYRNIKDNSSAQKMKMGDLAAVLSSLLDGDICILNAKALPTDKKYADDILTAFKEFALIVHIGKGSGANDVRLDLPSFTWLAVVDKMADMPEKYRSVFESVIEVKVDKSEMCSLEITATAIGLGMNVHQTAVELIAAQTKYDASQAAACVKHISDFMLVKGIEEKTVTKELAQEILSQFM